VCAYGEGAVALIGKGGQGKMEGKKVTDLNGTYLTCFGCPFFLTSALADRRGLVSKG
jgi:hypothetical protein